MGRLEIADLLSLPRSRATRAPGIVASRIIHLNPHRSRESKKDCDVMSPGGSIGWKLEGQGKTSAGKPWRQHRMIANFYSKISRAREVFDG